MRIALCAAQVPFVRGGAEDHCDNIYKELISRNYEVEYIKIPFKWYPPQEIINSCLVWRLLDLSESNGEKIDGIIATKFPTYLVKHQNKVVWLLHQHRSAYDNAYTEFDDLATYGNVGEIVRKRIYSIDEKSLPEAKKIYTNSQNVANRLWKFNKIRGEALYHPPPLMGRYYCGDYDDYIFYPSRIDSLKRQDMIIKCMKYVKKEIRLKIAGSGPKLEEYRKLAKEIDVEDRVDFLGYVPNNQLLELYSNAFCVIFTPLGEDMGYVTMESFLSKKPVITCSDSGGPLEFVENDLNGYVADPDPQNIAEKVNMLYESGLSKKMGENGYNKISNLNLSWDHVVEKLMEPIR